MHKSNFFLLFCLLTPIALEAADSVYIKVHFLYGSRPRREFRQVEHTWFGGRLGGHAGIETDSNFVIDFVPLGKLHIFSHLEKRHSKFTSHTRNAFFEIFGSHVDSVRFTTFIIPISAEQKFKLDSLSKAYRQTTPYDYAFFGMRCGAATYDLLAEIGLLPQYSRHKTWRTIFYPRKLRRKLKALAFQNGWEVVYQPGTSRRRWERE